MYLKELLKTVDLLSISNGSLEPLDLSKKELIRIFIDALLDEDNCQAVFRGENKTAAYKQSGANRNTKKREDELLANHGKIIFYIGTKAQSYLYEPNGVDMPFDLRSINSHVFEKIFYEVSSLINKGLYRWAGEFSDYFNKNSENDFLSRIDRVDEKEKHQIKIYYLWLLHVIGESEYKQYSNFLSTSKDHEVAKVFGKNELVYCGWVPRPIKERAAYLGGLIQLEQRMKCLGLPTYNNEPYPSEQEISLIGGLFPHYTLGIYHVPKKSLIVNTNLLDDAVLHLISNGMSEIVINMGIFIDQSQFVSSEELRNSQDNRWLSYSQENGYEDHCVNRSAKS